MQRQMLLQGLCRTAGTAEGAETHQVVLLLLVFGLADVISKQDAPTAADRAHLRASAAQMAHLLQRAGTFKDQVLAQ